MVDIYMQNWYQLMSLLFVLSAPSVVLRKLQKTILLLWLLPLQFLQSLCPFSDFLLCLKHPSIAFLFAKMDTTHIVIVASSQTILSFSNVQPRYKKSTATPQNIPSIATNPFAYVLDIFLLFTPAAASINAPANNGTKKQINYQQYSCCIFHSFSPNTLSTLRSNKVLYTFVPLIYSSSFSTWSI